MKKPKIDTDLKTTLVELKKLKPYKDNPRKKTEDAIPKIIASIKEHGFNQPIVTDKKFRICVGHSRYYAAKDLKLKKVPVFIKKFKSEKHFKAYNAVDNKTHEESSWDFEKLKETFGDIDHELLKPVFTEKELINIQDTHVDIPTETESDDTEYSEDDTDVKKATDNSKKVELVFTPFKFDKFVSYAEKASLKFKTNTLSDTIFKVLEKYFKK